MLDDRKPEPGAARGARAVAAVEALEQPRSSSSSTPRPSSATSSAARARREQQRRAGARVADRVRGEVLDDDLEHAPTQRQLDVGVGVDADRDVGALRAVGEPVAHLLEHRAAPRVRRARRPGARSRARRGRGRRRSARSSARPAPAPRRAGRRGPRRAASADSSRAISRASGVRSSCETAAVKPTRSSS